MENKENCIEFLTGDKTATLTFTNRKHITKIKKLYNEYKSDFEYFVENTDGSVCAKVPLKWIKLSVPRKVEYSEEQKAMLSERMKNMQKKRVENAANIETN